MSDLGLDIKRIVGIEKINKRLDALEQAATIGPIKAVAWINAAGNVASKVVGGIGAGTNDDDLGLPDEETAPDDEDEGGPKPGGSSNEVDPDADTTADTPEEFFDDIIDGAVNAIRGFTDANNAGYSIGVNFGKNMYGASADSGYVEGFYWTDQTPAHTPYATPAEAAEASYHYEQFVGAASDRYNYRALDIVLHATNVGISYKFDYLSGGLPFTDGVVTDSLAGVRNVCLGGEDYCPITEPTLPFYVPSSERILAPDKNGNFVAAPQERPDPAVYKNPQSKMILDFANGTRKAQIEKNNLGGSMITEVNPTTLEPIGNTYLYDSNGNHTITVDNVGRKAYTLQ